MRIQIQAPLHRGPDDERLWEEVRRYARMIPSEVEPNVGRVREIKEEIKKGIYLTPEVIEETSARLASRFMKRE